MHAVSRLYLHRAVSDGPPRPKERRAAAEARDHDCARLCRGRLPHRRGGQVPLPAALPIPQSAADDGEPSRVLLRLPGVPPRRGRAQRRALGLDPAEPSGVPQGPRPQDPAGVAQQPLVGFPYDRLHPQVRRGETTLLRVLLVRGPAPRIQPTFAVPGDVSQGGYA